MDSTAIAEALRAAVPAGAVEPFAAADGMPTIYVAPEHLIDVCRELRDRPELRFVLAVDMTAVDYMPREPRYEVVLHLASLGIAGFGDVPKRVRVKVRVSGQQATVPTVSGVWPSMGWAEREVYDLFGIHFEGHPDMRRILMPDDWEGHPARKDYPVQIKMTPKIYEPLQLTPQEFAKNVKATRERARQE
jgi:NADH-quinone oxidoreductase subunit C